MRTCDNWVVMKAPNNSHYRLLTGTSGGYLDGDSWRLNSGITRFEDDGDYYLVYGSSSSVYKVHKESYCVRMNNAHIFNQLTDKGWTLVDEDTDWLNMDWIISEGSSN
jgi:hypothetical protein